MPAGTHDRALQPLTRMLIPADAPPPHAYPKHRVGSTEQTEHPGRQSGRRRSPARLQHGSTGRGLVGRPPDTLTFKLRSHPAKRVGPWHTAGLATTERALLFSMEKAQ